MDIGEDYYYQRKNTKQRKYEGTSKRKGNTIRNFNWARYVSKRESITQEVVTKTVKPTDDWNTEKINHYCKTVLRDGGMRSNVTDYRNSDDKPANICKNIVSMKKRKRWELPNKMTEIIKSLEDRDDTEGPDIILVDHSIGPRGRTVNRYVADVTQITWSKVQGTKKQSRGAKSPKQVPKRKLTTRRPKKTFSNSTDLLKSLSTDVYPDQPRGKSKKSSRNARPKVKVQRPEVMYEFAWAASRDSFPSENRKLSLSKLKKEEKVPPNSGFRRKCVWEGRKRQTTKENLAELETWDCKEQWLDEERHLDKEVESVVESRSSSRRLVPIEDFVSARNRRRLKRSKKQVGCDRLTKVSLNELVNEMVNANCIVSEVSETCCDWPDSDDDKEEDGFVIIQ